MRIPQGAEANVLNWNIVIASSNHSSPKTYTFGLILLEKGMNLVYLPAVG